jgi:hypothetical protein
MVEHSKFWDRVETCHHELSSDYYVYIPCSTLFCSGKEVHCLKCGVYISHCDCFYNDGMSGWPMSRHRTEERKKNERQRSRQTV